MPPTTLVLHEYALDTYRMCITTTPGYRLVCNSTVSVDNNIDIRLFQIDGARGRMCHWCDGKNPIPTLDRFQTASGFSKIISREKPLGLKLPELYYYYIREWRILFYCYYYCYADYLGDYLVKIGTANAPNLISQTFPRFFTRKKQSLLVDFIPKSNYSRIFYYHSKQQ